MPLVKKKINELLDSNLSKKERKEAKRRLRIVLARKNFWLFCKAVAPEFYKDSRPHLREICDVLQAIYEQRIWKEGKITEDDFGYKMIKPLEGSEWHIAKTKDEVPEGAFICKKLKMNMPPRHGKSRTLILFECWCYGQNIRESVITASYNVMIAEEFSRYVRDEINKESQKDSDTIVMHDIFPNVELKEDDASVTKWSLKGSHFSYLGTGIGASVTSKGATILVMDDPIKDSVVANNEIELDNQWRWYTDTFKSRTDAVGGEPIEIINMTRWSSRDICGRIDSKVDESQEWFTLLKKVMNEETGEMLCEEIFNRARYYSQKAQVSNSIFRANYFQEPLDIVGRLYKGFMEYDELPKNYTGRYMEVDPANEGTDYLCAIAYLEGKDKMAYVLDVVYNNNKVEITLPMVARSIMENQIDRVTIEANNGGRLFAKLLREMLDKMRWFRTIIDCKPTTSQMNKRARITNGSEVVQTRVFFPYNWQHKYDLFCKDLFKYVSDGKNTHDDAPDCLTRVGEALVGRTGHCAVQKMSSSQVAGNTTNGSGGNIGMRVIRVARVIRR